MGVLDGKVAIITGAARGQGAAETRLFLAEGCAVVATDIDPPEQPFGSDDAQLAFAHHDVASEADWARVVALAVERFGGLDILVNNAALCRPKRVQETDLDLFDAHYRVNQAGVFLGMKVALTVMLPAGRGSIINVGSTASYEGAPGSFAYATTKWALRGMTKCAARDLGKTGVRVNALIPGLVETRMMLTNSPERIEEIKSAIPLGRIGRPDEIARAAVFMASDAASYMNGAEIVIDGGVSL